MDTYSNVISNNLAVVMKMLTSITILMMFPTLIASFFGMNLINTWESAWWGFPMAILISLVVTAVFWWYFRIRHWI